jgi:hypothetical protein
MAQWGNTDDAANSVIWGVAGYGKRANTTNRDAFFGNTTADAYVTGLTVGQFGVDTAEIAVTRTGNVASVTITSPGSGYTANATVTIGGVVTGGGSGATANATANATGRISVVNITAEGSSYESSPDVVIAAPTAITFNALTAVSNTTEFITLSGHTFQDNDFVKYLVATGNTALTNLANNTSYYVVSSNSTGVKLSSSLGGSAINLTAGVSETGHSLTGQTATGTVVLRQEAGDLGYAHAGWNVRKVLSNGRVQTETLVALSKNAFNASDASDDSVLPDA